MRNLAMEVSSTFALGWTVGAMIVGGVLVFVCGPPVYSWWCQATDAMRLGFDRVVYVVGLVAIVGCLIALAAYTT